MQEVYRKSHIDIKTRRNCQEQNLDKFIVLETDLYINKVTTQVRNRYLNVVTYTRYYEYKIEYSTMKVYICYKYHKVKTIHCPHIVVGAFK